MKTFSVWITTQIFGTCSITVNTFILFLHQLTGRLPVPGGTNIYISMSKKPSISMAYVACDSKLRSGLRCLHPCPGIEWESGVRPCVMPGLPTHLMQELNAGTVKPIGALLACDIATKLSNFKRKPFSVYFSDSSMILHFVVHRLIVSLK